MMKEERHRMIIEKLNRDQRINLVELSQLLDVSYDSIRRDVIELEDKGFLKKVHGGAVANSYLPFKTTQGLGIANQEMIQLTRKAQKLFEGVRIVMMDGGTTNFHIAEQLPKNLSITVITNNLPLAMVLTEHPNIETILLGGTYYKRYQITLSNEIMRQLDHFRPDLYLMGFNGIHPEAGVTIRHYEESLLKQKMLKSSRRVAVCAVEEKINTIESYKVCNWQQIDTMVCSLKPTDLELKPFKHEGLEIW
jgi:DeoR/GlpR family transcriptional regulator of sugar metabolism